MSRFNQYKMLKKKYPNRVLLLESKSYNCYGTYKEDAEIVCRVTGLKARKLADVNIVTFPPHKVSFVLHALLRNKYRAALVEQLHMSTRSRITEKVVSS